MEIRNASRLLLVCAMLFSPAVFAAEKLKADPYREAVNVYVEAAEAQLRAIRESVVASTNDAPDDVKQRYADATKRLDQCDEYVKRLRLASQKEFDPLKSEFEKARAEMVKSLEAARKAV